MIVNIHTRYCNHAGTASNDEQNQSKEKRGKKYPTSCLLLPEEGEKEKEMTETENEKKGYGRDYLISHQHQPIDHHITSPTTQSDTPAL